MAREKRVAVIVGTRPEIIKMAGIVRVLGPRAMLVHSGQHWDDAMSGAFMRGLELPAPAATLAIGGQTRASQIAEAIRGLEEIFAAERPAAVVVQGDTNTVVGGAIAANAAEIPLVHVEAGLRSHDRLMPEEHNRVVADHLADLCLAPTTVSRANLLAEGIPKERIVVTGNTVVGAVTEVLRGTAASAADRLAGLGLTPDRYVVTTIHRPENTDDPERLATLLDCLGAVAAHLPVLLPLHPRTRARIEAFDIGAKLRPLTVLEPLAYDDFVGLCARAAFTISDSGGIQEEASVWRRPVLVVRRSTERPEVLGSIAQLCEPGPELTRLALGLVAETPENIARLAELESPYGDEFAAQRCVTAIDRLLKAR